MSGSECGIAAIAQCNATFNHVVRPSELTASIEVNRYTETFSPVLVGKV